MIDDDFKYSEFGPYVPDVLDEFRQNMEPIGRYTYYVDDAYKATYDDFDPHEIDTEDRDSMDEILLNGLLDLNIFTLVKHAQDDQKILVDHGEPLVEQLGDNERICQYYTQDLTKQIWL